MSRSCEINFNLIFNSKLYELELIRPFSEDIFLKYFNRFLNILRVLMWKYKIFDWRYNAFQVKSSEGFSLTDDSPRQALS